MLPSGGLWLNASKSESRPEHGHDDTLCTAASGRQRYARRKAGRFSHSTGPHSGPSDYGRRGP